MRQVLQTPQSIPVAIEKSSSTIKYDRFGVLPTRQGLWTPAAGKSICLTAVQGTAPLAVSILLSDGSDDFLSLRITTPFSTVNQNFPSPYQLKANNTLMVRTSDEQIDCNTSGAATATQAAYNGRTDFTNVNNAVGLRNGSVASLASALLTQTGGNIVLGYNLLPALADYLDIEQVVIKFYCRLSLTLAVGVSSMLLNWRPNPQAAWIQLDQISLAIIGTLNYLTNPLEFDITTAVLGAANPWDVITTLQTSFIGSHTGLGIGNTIQLDAVEIEICTTGQNQLTLFGYEV
ncbi:hypothetical protein Dhaf_2211 [Desulfitobacterium hafniense DCB-2]|uniref:Uncharacterized protein n=1 Tax=Desulfitobacterium hafniense (strain DSM 10664 / DCB-2) TaxID=272564 RepID=B8FSN3_DESHD|nr:hypothetical protein [Desulfitobacterium hafniense]ACL20244.1 hypothetical protein Dhaf_2211 [Desulfitobacterium hafniense DCB-2]